ncbi:MAG: hypothetical protein IJT02_06065 [Synergistaceae bacterium]|nr:hypothetical protein [Synergistaceae bacterium]
MNTLFSKPVLAIIRLGGTIFFADYNTIIPMLAALPMKIAGCTFTRYVLVVYTCFAVPVFFVLASVINASAGRKYTLHAMLAVLFFPPLVLALLDGLIDVACLVPASLAVLLVKDYDPSSLDRAQIKRDVYISSVLLCTLLFRRYFAFFIVGYAAALVILSVYCALRAEAKITALRNALANIAIIGLFALLVMAVFFGPMLWRILKNDYADMYSGYDISFMQKVNRVVMMFGYLTFLLSGLGLVLSIHSGRMRRYPCFCATSAVISAVMFFRVQAMGVHHILILAPHLFIMSCMGIVQIAECLRSRTAGKAAASLCVLAMALGAANCYFPSVRPFLKPVSPLFCQEHNALRRSDIPALRNIVDCLNSLTAGTNKNVYVLASSGTLNADLLDSVNFPLEEHSLHNHNNLGNGNVDLRDGFPIDFLNADIVLTTEPIQLHLSEGSQEIVRFLAQEVMDSNSAVGRHFTRTENTFSLDKGVTAYIYEKQSPFETEDLEYLAGYFSRIYPGREKIFADRILGRADLWTVQRSKNRSLAVDILKWILDKGILSAESLAVITNRTVEEVNMLVQ